MDRHPLLDIQRTAGNAAALELIRRARAGGPVVMRQAVETDPASAPGATADTAPTAGTTTRRTLRQGSTGDDVKILQMKLRNLRERQHDRDKAQRARIDGIFGPLTHLDVVDFQTDTGLDADGIAGPKTWDALDSLVPETPNESEELAADDQFFEANSLRENGHYDEAAAIYEKLLESATSPERISPLRGNLGMCHHQRGRFGRAVQEYEAALAGRFNQEETRFRNLERLLRARQNQFLDSPPPDPEPPLPGEDATAAAGREGGGVIARANVQPGDSSPSTDLYKGKLANVLIGWQPPLAPGIDFDTTAEQRTRLFQQAVGIDVTGLGDARTWHALDTFSKPDVPFSIVKPLLDRIQEGIVLSKTDAAAALPKLEGGQAEADALGLAEIVKNTHALIALAHHRLSHFDEAISHYTAYLERNLPFPPHYGENLEQLRRAHAHEPPG